MSVTTEVMGKDYKSDNDIIDELMKTPEEVVDFDRTWNGIYEFVRCRVCNRPMLGHREEKCRHSDGYDEEDSFDERKDRDSKVDWSGI